MSKLVCNRCDVLCYVSRLNGGHFSRRGRGRRGGRGGRGRRGSRGCRGGRGGHSSNIIKVIYIYIYIYIYNYQCNLPRILCT